MITNKFSGRLLLMVLTLTLITGMMIFFTGCNAKEKSTVNIEGPGFDTPEQPVITYMEALKDNDIEKIISTFAVESYCASYDTKAVMEYERFFANNYAIQRPVTSDTDFGNELNKHLRVSTIINNLRQLSLAISYRCSIFFGDSESAVGTFMEGMPVVLRTDIDVSDELTNFLQKSSEIGEIQIGDIIYPTDVGLDSYYSVKFLANRKTWGDCIGANGYRSIGIEFQVEGIDFLLCMDVVRYDGKWFNLMNNGSMGVLLENSGLAGGISYDFEKAAIFTAEIDAIVNNLKEEYTEHSEDFDQTFEEMMDYFSMTELGQ